ncbi:MAG: cyclase family protein [Bacteroidota bacterium]
MKFFLSTNTFIDTFDPLDISIPISSTDHSVRAWYLEKPEISPVRSNEFLGSIEEGGSVNFRNIFFNPHGHGTHTESCGHITPKVYSVNSIVKNFFFKAVVISIEPRQIYNEEYKTLDFVITHEQVKEAVSGFEDIEALIIRSLPNDQNKLEKNYSDTNPPFFEDTVVELLNELQVKHFLTDLPSVDRELDGGKLSFHHSFWNVPESPNLERTITELIYVNSKIEDGEYILDLQVAPFENDASPSRPVLYKIKTVTN